MINVELRIKNAELGERTIHYAFCILHYELD